MGSTHPSTGAAPLGESCSTHANPSTQACASSLRSALWRVLANYGLNTAPNGYRSGELACVATPDVLTEGRYAESGVGLVLSGAVEYRGVYGAALAAPGAIVFGNIGEPFSCAHLDHTESRRLVFFFGADFMDAIADSAGVDRARFPIVALPPSRETAALAALMRDAALGEDGAAYDMGASALRLSNGVTEAPELSVATRRRVHAAVRYIHEHFAEPCTLDELATIAGLSRYHFARLFRTVAGAPPNQYVLHTRLLAAARLLETTGTPIARIALDVGFNDLSHFNASFKAALGRTPSAWR
jgi:AraC family transcriptional regulator